MIVYVVTEAYGASAVAETFTTWEDALAYAKERASNYRQCAATWAEHTDHGCELCEFSAKWTRIVETPRLRGGLTCGFGRRGCAVPGVDRASRVCMLQAWRRLS